MKRSKQEEPFEEKDRINYMTKIVDVIEFTFELQSQTEKRVICRTLELSESSSIKYGIHCPRLSQCYHSLGIRRSRVSTHARLTATWNLSVHGRELYRNEGVFIAKGC